MVGVSIAGQSSSFHITSRTHWHPMQNINNNDNNDYDNNDNNEYDNNDYDNNNDNNDNY